MRPAKVCQSWAKTFWERSSSKTLGLSRTPASTPITDSDSPDALRLRSDAGDPVGEVAAALERHGTARTALKGQDQRDQYDPCAFPPPQDPRAMRAFALPITANAPETRQITPIPDAIPDHGSKRPDGLLPVRFFRGPRGID